MMRVFSCINFNIYWINVRRLFSAINASISFSVGEKEQNCFGQKRMNAASGLSSNFNWNLFAIMMAKGVVFDILWWYAVFENCASTFIAKVAIKERDRENGKCAAFGFWIVLLVGQKRISKLTRRSHIKLRDWCRGRNMNEIIFFLKWIHQRWWFEFSVWVVKTNECGSFVFWYRKRWSCCPFEFVDFRSIASCLLIYEMIPYNILHENSTPLRSCTAIGNEHCLVYCETISIRW